MYSKSARAVMILEAYEILCDTAAGAASTSSDRIEQGDGSNGGVKRSLRRNY